MNGKKVWDTIRKYQQFGVDVPGSDQEFEDLSVFEKEVWENVEAAAKGGKRAACVALHKMSARDPACEMIQLMSGMTTEEIVERDLTVNSECWAEIATVCGSEEKPDYASIVYKIFRREAQKQLPSLLFEIVFPEITSGTHKETFEKAAKVALETRDVELTYNAFMEACDSHDADFDAQPEDEQVMWAEIVADVLDADVEKYELLLTDGQCPGPCANGDGKVTGRAASNDNFVGTWDECDELADYLRFKHPECNYTIRMVK